MRTRWAIGECVRVTRNVRNDGTYPGAATGDLLVRRGSLGAVVDLGTFLQDEIIYSVHFLDDDRIVGCREDELTGGDAPWFPSRFETRERVAAARVLVLGSGERVPRGALGEVLRVLRDGEAIVYHLHFECLRGRTLSVPESALASPARVSHD